MGVKPARKVLLGRLLPATDALAASAFEELLARGNKLARPNYKVTKVLRMAAKNVIRFRKAKDPKGAAAEAMRQMRERSDAVVATYRGVGTDADAMRTMFRNAQMMTTFFANPFMPMVMNGVLALAQLKKLEEKMGCGGRFTTDMQIGSEGNVVTEMGLALGDLADLVAADPELQTLLAGSGEGLGEALSARTDAFGEAYRDFMRLYGFRCAGELDISQPRYEEDPSLLLAQISSTAEGKEPGSHRRDYEAKNTRARKAAEGLVAAAGDKLGAGAARKARINVERFQSYFSLREHFKYLWMRNLAEARKSLLRIGGKMADAGQLACADDIMHLHMKEVYAALEGGADMRALVEERKVEFERVSRLTPPRIITSEGEVLMGGLSRKDLPEGALAGAGVSADVVEGTAKVVLDPKGASVAKGEILVASFTDPGWTPLFVDAAGVVTEVGGMLTHGAVVAREYGIPGVVGVVDATKLIRTGQRIRVDGTAGIVEVLGD